MPDDGPQLVSEPLKNKSRARHEHDAGRNPCISALGPLVAEFLRMLANERGASAHTLRAYQRELHGVHRLYRSDVRTASRPPAPLSTRTFAPTWARSMNASSQRPLRLGRSPPFAVGSSGWRVPGRVEQNVASLVATPRLPKHLPRVPSIEQMNRMVDTVKENAASWPARDKAIMELLYGCGIRNAELTGLEPRRHSLGQ